MEAYVFGRHNGDLPTHLVGNGDPGNRIRAMARLNEGEHDVFYAIEADTTEDLERHLASLRDAGSTLAVTLEPHDEAAVTLGLPPLPQPPLPAWLPPYPWLLFVHGVIEDIAQFLERLVDNFGVEAVAAWRSADGSYVVEVGAEDRDALESAIEDLREPVGLRDDVLHFTPFEELHRA